jgi:TP901 family phage tail tape measure protein
MTDVATLKVKLILDTSDYIKNLKNASDEVESWGKKTSGFFEGVAQFAVGGVISKGITSIAGGIVEMGQSMVGAMTGGIGKAMDLDQRIANIGATMGVSKAEAEKFKGLISDLSLDPKLVVDTNQAADAIELLASAGSSTEEIMGGLAKGTIQLANATGNNFSVAASIATDAMALWSKQGLDMTQVADGVSGVIKASKYPVEQYQLALANAGGVVAGMGVSFKDFNAVLTATQSNFASASDAGTSFKAFMQRMSKPTKEMQEAMDRYGISLFDTTGKIRPMNEVVQQLNSVFNGTATITETVGGVTKKMANEAKNAQSAIPKLTNTISEQKTKLGILKQELEATAEKYGSGSVQAQKKALAVKTLSDRISENEAKYAQYSGTIQSVQNSQEKTITSTKTLTDAEKANLAATLGGADGARILLGLSKVSVDEFNKLSDSISATGQAQEAAATRVDSLSGAWDILKGIVEGVQIQIGDKFLPVLRSLVEMGSTIAGESAPAIIDFFSSFASGLDRVIKAFQSGGLSAAFSQLGTEVSSAWSFIQPVLAKWGTSFWDWLVGPGGAIQQGATYIAQMGTSVGAALVTAWPTIQATLAKWGTLFWDWLVGPGGALAQATTKLGELLAAVTKWLNDNWPTIQETLKEWGNKFWDWLIGQDGPISKTADAMNKISDAVFDWVNSDAAQQALSKIGKSLGELIYKQFGDTAGDESKATDVVLKLIASLGKAVISLGASVAIAGGQLAASFVGGVLSRITGSEVQVWTFNDLKKFTENLSKVDWKATGEGWGNNIKDGFTSRINDLKNEVSNTFTNIKNAITDKLTEWTNIGQNIVQGVIDGIRQRTSSVISTITSLAGDIVRTFKRALSIGSPSKLLSDEVGEEGIGGGVVQGVERSFGAIQGAITKAVSLPDMALSSVGAGLGLGGGNTTTINNNQSITYAGQNPTSGIMNYNTLRAMTT